MRRVRNILAGGWLGKALSVFTRGFYGFLVVLLGTVYGTITGPDVAGVVDGPEVIAVISGSNVSGGVVGPDSGG